jgi:hypothetical protein
MTHISDRAVTLASDLLHYAHHELADAQANFSSASRLPVGAKVGKLGYGGQRTRVPKRQSRSGRCCVAHGHGQGSPDHLSNLS